MKANILKISSISFISLSALSIFLVSCMALHDPQKVMDLVQVKLNNTDAYSSIRGVYGGVGITIIAAIILFSQQSLKRGLLFISILWGMYSLSRVITIFTEGNLHAFGKQWLFIESVFCIISTILLIANKSKASKVK